MTDRDIMQQALDALRQCEFTSPPAQRQIVKNALAALNERLAQPEQQEQWDAIPDAFNEWWNADYDDTGNPYRKDSPAYWAWSGWKAASKQLEQESVAWIYRDSWGTMKLSQVTPPPVGAFPVYTAPPQRKPLTDEQKGSMWMATTIDPCSHKACYLRGIADAEAAHGIKE